MRRTVTCLAAATVISLATPIAAHAATVKVVDAKDDVRQASYDEADESASNAPAPQAAPDISSTTITHSRSRISVRVDFDDLDAPIDAQGTFVLLDLAGTKRGQAREIAVGGTADVTGASLTRRSSERELCASSLRSRVDWDADVISVSFPRSCAGNPSKVKLAGGVTTLEDVTVEGSGTITYDDAMAKGNAVDSFGVRYSRWVKRG